MDFYVFAYAILLLESSYFSSLPKQDGHILADTAQLFDIFLKLTFVVHTGIQGRFNYPLAIRPSVCDALLTGLVT